MICDVDVLLNQQDTFKLIVQHGYPIVIPINGRSPRVSYSMLLSMHPNEIASAIIKLFNLTTVESPKFEPPQANAAQAAIESIKTAIEKHNNVQVLTPDGEDITHITILDGKAPPSDPNGDNQAVLIAADLNNQLETEGSSEASPAILLTEDRAIRIEAALQGVTALATSTLKKLLTSSSCRRRSSSVASSTSWVVIPLLDSRSTSPTNA